MKGGDDAQAHEARGPRHPGGRLLEVELDGEGAPGAESPGGPPPVSRPRIKPSIDLIQTSDGTLHFFRGGDDDYVVENPDAAALALIQAMDGTRELRELAAHLERRGHPLPEGEIDSTVRQLVAAGLAEDAATDSGLAARALERYDRQLRYFSDAGPPGVPRTEYQRRLAGATVAVLGLGGLGSWVALSLAAAGVGRLVGVDGDHVEPSNLNRQVLFGDAQVGALKAHAAKARLAEINADLEFESVTTWLTCSAEIEEVIQGADFVVDAVDTPVHEIERWVNAACFAQRIPYIAMSQFPPLVRVGPTYVPGQTGCYACQEHYWREQFPLFEELADHRRRHPCPAASFGPASAVIGGLVALEVAHSLTGLSPPATAGAYFTLDIRTLELEREVVPRWALCDICRT